MQSNVASRLEREALSTRDICKIIQIVDNDGFCTFKICFVYAVQYYIGFFSKDGQTSIFAFDISVHTRGSNCSSLSNI